MKNNQEIRLLLVDYDNCLVSPYSPREDLLTVQMLTQAKTGGYTGFYGVTHRSIMTLEVSIRNQIAVLIHISKLQSPSGFTQYIKEELLNRLAIALKQGTELSEKEVIEYINTARICHDNLQKLTPRAEIHPERFFTSSITSRFRLESGLPCLGISTPDDAYELTGSGEIQPRQGQSLKQGCGEWFRQRMLPEEQALLKTARHFPERSSVKAAQYEFDFIKPFFTLSFDHLSKNLQLYQVINDAVAKYPGKKLIFDYFDDRVDLCKKAVELAECLPETVQLKIYRFQAWNEFADFSASKIFPYQTIRGRLGSEPIESEKNLERRVVKYRK